MPVLPPNPTKEGFFVQERDKVIAEEVRKLLEVDFIKEVYYFEWFANVVMVKKNKRQMENMRRLH